mmetsp:Transcript_9928/g.14958  ORF Transcript_9928/g.14958 Transcript_9928/m.14958 type:complete len:113 (-) Transcript_9928:247-585(-)|eukprot:CAMPEP_0185024718 /NCGR_PEP_ID=MMETSP1103-20130426/7900_1 /TAXON_ID=36769 /ORGANISM="Paraphysomonas bandaiensis, Strain Caron Lab Isolate" /LENGTH=112 /DNA_ID=CAMNT_0027557759 /DNA_START=46 /DNA_END=384 /DNA_ORIENTATION=+
MVTTSSESCSERHTYKATKGRKLQQRRASLSASELRQKQEARREAKRESSRRSRLKAKAELEYYKQLIDELQCENQYLRSCMAGSVPLSPCDSTTHHSSTVNCSFEHAKFVF